MEDEDEVRELVREMLEGDGYTVLAARHPTEALEIAGRPKGPIHLLLTDVVMPQMGGPQLAETLAALCRGIKVLYMSGYTADALGRRGVLNPGTSLIHKPFTPYALAGKVREVLDARQHPDPR